MDKEEIENMFEEYKTRLYELIGPAAKVYFNYVEGPLDEIESTLVERITAIKEEPLTSLIKIGKSSDPINRFQTDYEKKGFERMEVIYRSKDPIDIEGEDGAKPEDRGAEGRMLHHFLGEVEILNIDGGSAGNLAYERPYHYLYVAVAGFPLKSGPWIMHQEKVNSIIQGYIKEIDKILKERTPEKV